MATTDNSTSFWTIANRVSGANLGTFPGATEADALSAMRRAAGYATDEDLAHALDTTVEALDDNLIVEEASCRDAFEAAKEALASAQATCDALDADDSVSAEDPRYTAAYEALEAAEAVLESARDAYRDSDEPRTWSFRGDGGEGHEDVECAPSELSLREIVEDGTWEIDPEEGSIAVDIYATCEETGEERSALIILDPEEPECLSGAEHDWSDDHHLVGGCESNPGVWSAGGCGIRSTYVCTLCGMARHRTTASQGHDTEHDHDSTRYEPGETSAEHLVQHHREIPQAILDALDSRDRKVREHAIEFARAAVEAGLLPEEPVGEIVWERDAAASYVMCCYGAEGDEPGDCYTRIGQDEAGARYVDDGDDAERTNQEGPFATREAALERAKEIAEENHEGLDSEDADDMSARLLDEAAGEPAPDGDWCVYWETSLEDEGPRERYATQDAAEAAAARANRRLEASHPGGNLRCGFAVRQLVDGEWVSAEHD